MLVVSGLPTPRYLRTIGLQQWTPGVGWSIDDLTDGPVPDSPPTPDEALVTVSAVSYRDEFLPIYKGTTSLAGIDPAWSYDAACSRCTGRSRSLPRRTPSPPAWRSRPRTNYVPTR